MSLQFWQKKTFGRRDGPEIDVACLEALSGGYFFQLAPTLPSQEDFAHHYVAVLSNENFSAACESLLQLGIRARMHLIVRPGRRILCTLAIAASQDVRHVIGQFFPEVRKVSATRFERASLGRLVFPRILTRFTIPRLPGMDEALPLPIQIPPSLAADAPSIRIGDVLSPYNARPVRPALLPMDRMMRGVLVAGTTGGGKTNTVLGIIDKIHADAWVLVFDVKREYRTLHRSMNAGVYGFRGRNILTHNLLKPVGPPDQWVKQFASILSEVIFSASPAVGSKDVVIEELDKLYQERGIYEGSTDYPHVGHLVAALEARASERGADRARGWIASALRVLRSLMVGSTREAFCVQEGISLERLQQGVTVVELDGIGDSSAQAFLVSVILQKLRNQRLGGPERERLEGLIVVEEAQHMLSQGSEATSVIATACREIRSQGVGLVFVTQLPSAFSHHALANVNTLVFHRLVHPTDRSLALRLLGLERESDKILDGLEVGQALVRTDRVFLVQVPRQGRPWVSDDDLPETAVPTREQTAASIAQRTEVRNRSARLSDLEEDVFLAIAEGRAVHLTGISDLLRLSRGDLRNALTGLVRRRALVGYASAKIVGPGAPRTVYFLRPYAEEAYRQRMERYPDRKTERSPHHADVVDEVIEKLGIVRKAHPRFDILYDEGRVDRAIEVETGSNNDVQILENLTKSIELQGEGRFVAADESTVNRIVQIAVRYAYGQRIPGGSPLKLRLATLDGLPTWTKWEVWGHDES